MGFNFSMVMGEGRFLVRADMDHPVEFEGICEFGAIKPVTIQNDSDQTLIVRNTEERVVVYGRGETYLEDVSGGVIVNHPKARVWARQLNLQSPDVNMINKGGALWVLGMRSYNFGIKLDARAGTRSEVIGAHLCTGYGEGEKSLAFRVEDCAVTLAGLRETRVRADGGFATNISETRGWGVQTLPRGKDGLCWTLYSGAPSSPVAAAK
jgi:hypothetical protein